MPGGGIRTFCGHCHRYSIRLGISPAQHIIWLESMGAPIHRTTDWQSDRYDMIIDARSPAEFADDHISGAVNMPSLSDDEREIVGTIYKQKSAFEARKIGASMTAKNIATHIETHLADKPAGFTPLIHCWRGGQRSSAFAQICSEIAGTCYVLEGGYKFYRTQVLDNENIARAIPIYHYCWQDRLCHKNQNCFRHLAAEARKYLILRGWHIIRARFWAGYQNLSHHKSCLNPILLANCQALIKTGRYL